MTVSEKPDPPGLYGLAGHGRGVTSRAVVEVAADASKVGDQVQRAFNSALSGVDTSKASAALNKVGDAAKKSFTEVADQAEKAGDKIGDGVTQGTDKARDALNRFATKAADAGKTLGEDIEKGATKAKSALGEVGDKGKKEFGRIQDAGETAASHISGVFGKLSGFLLGAFAAVKFVDLLKESSKASDDLGASMRRTGAIISATGGAAGLLVADVREIAKGLSVKIGVDSLEIQDAINILLTFRSVSGPVLKQAIGLAADLSTVFGQSLAGSATQLGKALQDPIAGIAALHRVGVDFSEVQKAQIQHFIDTNQLAKAQAVILNEVSHEVGGVAEASADAGDKIGVFLTDLKRSLGESLADLIDEVGPQLFALADVISPALTVIGAGIADLLKGLLPALAPVISALSEGLSIIGPALEPLGQIVGAILADLAPVLVPISAIIGAIVEGLTPALAALQPVVTSIGEIATAVFAPLAPLIVLVGKTIGDILLPVALLLGEIFHQMAPLLGEIASTLGALLVPLFAALGPVVAILVSALNPLIPVIVSLLPPFLQIVVALTPLIDLLAVLITLAAKILTPIIQLAAVLISLLASKAIVPLITLLAQGLTLVLKPLELLVPLIDKFGNFVQAINWATVGKAIGGAFVSAWHAVEDFFVGIGHWFAALPGEIGGFLASLPQKLMDALAAAFDAGLHAIGVGIGLILAGIIILPGKIIDAISALPGMLASFVSNLFTTFIDDEVRGIETVVGFFMALPGRLLAAVVTIGPIIGNAIVAALAFIKNNFVAGFEGMIAFAFSVPGRLLALGSKFLEAGVAMIKGFFSGLGQAGSFVGDLAAKITGAIKGFLNSVIDKINSGIQDVDDKLPGITLPHIPHLATGGMTTREGLANLHPNELVMPLESSRTVDLLARAIAESNNSLRAVGIPTSATSGAPAFDIRVYIGERELTELVDVQINERNRALTARVQAGAR
jgi:hypothetical protein